MLGTRVQTPLKVGRVGGVRLQSRRVMVPHGLPAARLSLHVGETTVEVPFSKDSAEDLNASLLSLLKTFSEKQKAERPKRWEAMEYKYKGSEAGGDLEYLEVFCNPNGYTTAFEAKVMVTIRSRDGVRVVTEVKLSNFKADVEAYLN